MNGIPFAHQHNPTKTNLNLRLVFFRIIYYLLEIIKVVVIITKGGFCLIRKVEISSVNTSKLPVLSNEEKNELFKRIKEGDKEAREQFINGNLRLVLSVIQRFRRKRRIFR